MRSVERTDGQADRRTDMTKLMMAFGNFAKASETCTKRSGSEDGNISFTSKKRNE